VYEVANGLVSGRRRTPPRIHDVEIETFLHALSAMPIEIAPSESITACRSVLELAAKHAISAYDAAYLDLALRRGLPIGTLDGTGRRQGLKQAAEAAGVPIFRAQ
jgi:predicted nucleic acid-binding protein